MVVVVVIVSLLALPLPLVVGLVAACGSAVVAMGRRSLCVSVCVYSVYVCG